MEPINHDRYPWLSLLKELIYECDKAKIPRESTLGKAVVKAKIAVELDNKRYSWTDDLYGDF